MDRKDRSITVYGGASERVEREYGEPFASLPTSFCLIILTSGGKTQQLLNMFCKFYLEDRGPRIKGTGAFEKVLGVSHGR